MKPKCVRDLTGVIYSTFRVLTRKNKTNKYPTPEKKKTAQVFGERSQITLKLKDTGFLHSGAFHCFRAYFSVPDWKLSRLNFLAKLTLCHSDVFRRKFMTHHRQEGFYSKKHRTFGLVPAVTQLLLV